MYVQRPRRYNSVLITQDTANSAVYLQTTEVLTSKHAPQTLLTKALRHERFRCHANPLLIHTHIRQAHRTSESQTSPSPEKMPKAHRAQGHRDAHMRFHVLSLQADEGHKNMQRQEPVQAAA